MLAQITPHILFIHASSRNSLLSELALNGELMYINIKDNINYLIGE